MTLAFYTFILITIIRLSYWAFFFNRIGRYKSDIKEQSEQFVSVIVCAKDEYQNLTRLIPILLNQDFKKYQVIIVDDHSNDETHKLKQQYFEIDWVSPDSNVAGKKVALSSGIKTAKHEIILLTDADCEPTVNWITSMVNQMKDNDIILGYSPMMREGSCLNLNTFSRYETIMTALQYFGYALAKIPYMGVGRNILYRKSIFNKVGGFSGHSDLVSGDDDLFLQDVITKIRNAKIGLALDQHCYVPTWSNQNWKNYFNQKRRHASTSIKYTIKHKFLLSLWAISHIAWMLLLLVCAIGMGSIEFAFVAIIFWILATILHYKSIVRLEGSDLMKWFPILDIGLGINYIIVAVLLIKDKITKRQAWT